VIDHALGVTDGPAGCDDEFSHPKPTMAPRRGVIDHARFVDG